MNIIYVLAPLALLLGSGFAISYIVATHRGQFDDLETPAHRMLIDDEFETPKRTPKRTPRRTPQRTSKTTAEKGSRA